MYLVGRTIVFVQKRPRNSAKNQATEVRRERRTGRVQRIKIGRKFGSLTVIGRVRIDGKLLVRCRCSCGRRKNVIVGNLGNHHTRSCGRGHQGIHSRPKHGEGRRGHQTVEFVAYHNMKARCRPNHKQHKDYYDKGVRCYFRTLGAFLNALKTKANPSGRRPTPAHSIDRIDTNGSYQKGNIRWADRLTQNRNKRKKLAMATAA